MIKNKVLQTIKENKLIKKGDKIVIGISGGPDSVCLFNILHSLKKELGIKIILAHINYKFRGQDSDKDERFVKRLAYKFKTKLYIKKVNSKDYRNKNNLEEYFREIRYKFFDEVLKKERANKITVAHNKDDQVETVLMFLLRGSGLSGISGMKIKNRRIIRPFFEVSKKEILAYLKNNKVKFRKDKTNEDTNFTRNKIRHQLIPYLEKNFNPNLRNTLFVNAQIIQNDYELLLRMAKENFKDLIEKKKGSYFIRLKRFNKIHSSLKRKIIILTLAKFNKKISLALCNEILRVIKDADSGARKYVEELEIIKNYDKIEIRKRREEEKIKKTFLEINKKTDLKKLKVKIRSKKVDNKGKISKNKCYIDLDKAGKKLYVRSRREGDKFYPKGIEGSQKLKDFFINNKVFREERNKIPLITNNKDEIVWIVGYRLNRQFEANKNSKNILEIQIT